MALEAQKQRINRAINKLEGGLADLYRKDGSKKFSEVQHAESVQALLAEYDAEVKTALESVSLEEREFERRLQALSGDPAMSLGTEELSRAAALAPFVKEDALSLPLEQVAQRMRASLADQSRVDVMLWRRYAQARLQAEREASTDGLVDSNTTHEVMNLTGQMGTYLDPDRHKRERDLQAGIGEARGLRDLAARKRPNIDANGDAAARTPYIFETTQDVVW